MRTIVCGLVLALMIFFLHIAAADAVPDIQGKTGILMDAATGQVLWEKNAHQQMYPASTTKIMTALLVLEQGHLEDVVVTSRNARSQSGNSLYLEEGEKILVRDLLYGLMLRSGNDAAVVAAEYIAGSVEEFAELMNRRARELGALKTNFVNPSGLHHDAHVSTAFDLAIISKHAMSIPEFREIVQTSRMQIPWPTEQWDRQLDSSNRFLTRYPGANGIKTGYTSRAKGTFVGSANRDGFELIAVTLNTEQIYDDAAAILNYGYDNYVKKLIIASEQPISLAPVRYGDRVQVMNLGKVYYTAPKDKSLNIHITPVLNELEAPVVQGVLAGHLEVSVNGELISTVPLVTIHPVKRKITTFWWFYAVVLIVVYLPLRISVYLRRRRKKIRYLRRKRYYEQSF